MFRVNDTIASTKNPRVKNFQHLQKARERIKQGVFITEGRKEIAKMVKSGYRIQSVFFCPELINDRDLQNLLGKQPPELFAVSREVFGKIAYRENSGGVVILAEPKAHSLSQLKLGPQPLVLVLEGVEKPGNLGAILRSADGAGVDAVIVCDPHIDLYNPNAVRASLGCLFTVQLAVGESSEAIEWLKAQQLDIFCTYLEAARPYYEVDLSQPCALVMGTEATGITPQWVEAATHNIIIPMQGQADSLNVSTATAIVLFEARRQRSI